MQLLAYNDCVDVVTRINRLLATGVGVVLQAYGVTHDGGTVIRQKSIGCLHVQTSGTGTCWRMQPLLELQRKVGKLCCLATCVAWQAIPDLTACYAESTTCPGANL
jgi:hypothetical protein